MGTTSEKLTYLSGTKDKLKTVINAMGGEIDDDTFRSYPETLNDLVLKSIKGEIDLYDEYPKQQSTGTNITIDGIEEGKALIELNPSELSQATTPTPDMFGTNMIDQSVLLSTLTYNSETGYYSGTPSSAINSTITGIFKENTRYTVKCLDYTTSTASNKESIQFKFNYTDSTENHINLTNKTTATQQTLTSTSGKTVSSFQIIYVRARDINIKDLMLYEGTDTAKEFEPYQSQTYPIKLGSLEYCKIGDYSDEFYLDNGTWYIRRNIDKIDSYNGETITTQYISTTGGLDTGATVYYGLSNPTSEAITDTTLIEQLNNLYNQIKSYKGQTNITQTNAELPFEITISALKELDI